MDSRKLTSLAKGSKVAAVELPVWLTAALKNSWKPPVRLTAGHGTARSPSTSRMNLRKPHLNKKVSLSARAYSEIALIKIKPGARAMIGTSAGA